MKKKKQETSETQSNLPAKATKTPTNMEMLINKANNSDIIKAMAGITIADTAGKFPSISQLNLLYTPQRVETAITALIVDAGGYFENTLTPTQARDVAVEISTQYYYLSLEDVYLALQRLKSGQIYGKLTPNKLLNAATTYANERLELAAQRSLNAHLAQKDSRLNYDKNENQNDNAFQQFKAKYNAKKEL